jgi:ABC-type polysaccharide/polyol phosphate transport system ATPase subunit
MDNQNPVLVVKNVSKKYSLNGSKEPFWALKDVSFELGQGEILGIVGKNGAGKSTLLKILSDVIAPSSGSVKFNGVVVSILDIGTGFHPDLSGYDNIFLNASLFGMSKKEVHEKLNDIIQFSGIESFIHEPVRNYSNGMYLRLAFSIAVHVNAHILLLDEVVAVGDSEFKEKCYNKLHELAGSGLTIILVTHKMSQVLEFCTRCLWLEHGKKIQEGTAIDVVERYISYFSSNKTMLDESGLIPLHKELNETAKDFAIIRSITVDNGSENNPWPLYTGNPIYLRINCEKITSEKSLELGLSLTNLDGLRIFVDSFALREDYSYNIINKPGNYLIECIIPAEMLTRGIYNVSIMISKSFELLLNLENIASFKVLPSTSENGADAIFNRMNTVIAPRLKWTILQVSNR